MADNSVSTNNFKIPKSVITFDSETCTGCGTCELMCSLHHEGIGGNSLSRCHVARDPFNAEYKFSTCKQCLAPSCYVACPLPGEAICIDEETGVKFIDESECIGCGDCIESCPFDPPEVRLNEDKNVAYKCDMCRDRKEGPVCVEYCPVGALSLDQNKGR